MKKQVLSAPRCQSLVSISAEVPKRISRRAFLQNVAAFAAGRAFAAPPGVWVAAGIGMASAAGLYLVAVISTVLALIGLETVGCLNRFLRAKGDVDG